MYINILVPQVRIKIQRDTVNFRPHPHKRERETSLRDGFINAGNTSIYVETLVQKTITRHYQPTLIGIES